MLDSPVGIFQVERTIKYALPCVRCNGHSAAATRGGSAYEPHHFDVGGYHGC
jgi:hypothetical protein